MHRLQPAIDVTPDEEDVTLILSAPLLAEAVADLWECMVDQEEGRYDLASLGQRMKNRLWALRYALNAEAAAYHASSLNFYAEQIKGA